jgi:hypothetical protein
MKAYIVRCVDLDDSWMLCAFTDKNEAKKYELALDAEKDPEDDFLYFMTTEVDLYNNCEQVVENA